jgi:hypothetical protein
MARRVRGRPRGAAARGGARVPVARPSRRKEGGRGSSPSHAAGILRVGGLHHRHHRTPPSNSSRAELLQSGAEGGGERGTEGGATPG